MDVKNIKKGKQSKHVNTVVKQLDEESVTGSNLFEEPMDDVELGKSPHLIQLGNLRVNRKNFRNPQDGRVYSAKGCCTTLTLCMSPKILITDNGEYKVRELSGYEGLLLMGVDREDADKIKETGLSNAQMLKLAGNSIVVDVMSNFFKEMIKC